MEAAESTEVATEEAPETESNVQQIRTLQDMLPDEYKSDPVFQDIPDLATLAKVHRDTKAMVGASVRIPTDDAGQEAIEAFRAKLIDNPHLGLMLRPDPDNPETMQAVQQALGVPEDASGYERPEDVDPEAFGALANTAKELGLTKQQYAEMAAAHAALNKQAEQQYVQERDAGVKQLHGEWGHSFDERVGRVTEMVKALGGHEGLEGALANGAIDAPTLRFLDTVATQMGKEGAQVASQIGAVTQDTPSELRQRRDELIQRQLNENLTGQQRDDLQKRVIAISEKLTELGG